MNKQELIEKIKKLPFVLLSERYISQNYVLELLEQLDEPEKVAIPQYIADKIEYMKKYDYNIFDAIRATERDDKFYDWVFADDNIETFTLAWQYGYEVEKEKRYRISMPRARNHKNHAQILCEKDEKIFWCGEWYPFRTKFTRKQLEEAGFGWVFDCEGVEVEVVE